MGFHAFGPVFSRFVWSDERRAHHHHWQGAAQLPCMHWNNCAPKAVALKQLARHCSACSVQWRAGASVEVASGDRAA